MSIAKPLSDTAPTDQENQGLVMRARAGDRRALEELVQRRQGWIYNIALRILFHPQDAEDATQEILVKVVTRLSSLEGRSSFRAWLYRIVVNHVLNMKRGRTMHLGLHHDRLALYDTQRLIAERDKGPLRAAGTINRRPA